MPPAKSSKVMDQYSNKAVATITMSAANTLTFEQVRFGVGIFQGIALVLNKVEFFPTLASIREVVAATDALTMALVTSDNITTLQDATDPSVLVKTQYVGVGATVAPVKLPIEIDLRTNPGGGLIVPANPLYVAMTSGGFAAAGEMDVVIHFTFKQLADKDYIELIQASIPANI